MTAERSGGFTGTGRVNGVGSGVSAQTVSVVLTPDAQAVRSALARLMATLRRTGIGEDDAGTIELVLAEVLNNVVEHAFAVPDAARGAAQIKVTVQSGAAGIACEVRDNGCPMPNAALPEGLLPDHETETDDLPEGGFGWFLIQTLASELSYERAAEQNVLRFRVALAPG